MRTFRAYLQDDAGAITWAAWIDAVDLSDAKLKAQDRCRESTPTVELWCDTDRRLGSNCELDPV
jgi:hypothetical protein